MRALVLAALLVASSCLQLGTGTGTGTGAGMESGTVPVSSLVAAKDGGPTGRNCFADPTTKAVFCTAIDACPGATVDPGAFPDCGYAMRDGVELDLECLCGTALCPIGVPTTCEQAKALLEAQTAFVVCGQQAEGRCVELALPKAGPHGTCDPSCRDECAGAPSCIQLCGC